MQIPTPVVPTEVGIAPASSLPGCSIDLSSPLLSISLTKPSLRSGSRFLRGLRAGLLALLAVGSITAHGAPFVINTHTGGVFTPSFRDIGAPFDENNTTHFGWGAGQFDGATNNELIDNPAVTLGVGGLDGSLNQVGTTDILSSSNSIYTGTFTDPITLALEVPTIGTVGTGFTTIIVQGRTAFGSYADPLLNFDFLNLAGATPTVVVATNAANQGQFWAKYEIEGNASSYSLNFNLAGGFVSIAELTVDTSWNATGYAEDTAVAYTVAPTMTSPASDSSVKNPITVAFSLPQAALSGTVKLSFGANELVLASSQETAGAHSFTFDPANPTSAPEIASGAPIADGTYTVTLTYENTYGHLPASVTKTNVTVDTVAPAGGTFVVTEASPAAVTATFADWTDAAALTYEVREGATIISAANSNSAVTFDLAEGTHTITGRVSDGAGNFTDSVVVVVVEWVDNGNFTAGDTDFDSNFTYTAGTSSTGGAYSIVDDPSDLNPALSSFGDHTSGAGQMMVVNGKADVVWQQTLTPVVPGRWYRVSAYAASAHAAAPAKLQLNVNTPTPLRPAQTLPTTPGQWTLIVGYWFSGEATSATAQIRNLTTATGVGNDFALDDIAIEEITVPTDPGLLDTTAPTLTVSAPGGTVSGAFEVTGTIKENFLLSSFTVTVNGTAQTVAVPDPFAPNRVRNWSVSGVVPQNGPNVIVVEAVDTSGNKKTLSKTTTYVNTAVATLAGTYNAVLLPSGTATNDTTGLVTVTVTTLGVFTGKATLGGVTVPFTGYLGNDGGARFKPTYSSTFDLIDKTEFDSHLGVFALSVSESSGLSGTLSTQVTGGTTLATFAGEKAPYTSSNTVPAALLNQSVKGVYAVAFPSKAQTPTMDPALYPQGDGFVTLTLSEKGNISYSGYLADGSKCTGSTKLRDDGTAPFFVQLYRKGGAIAGNLAFDNSTNTDVAGANVLWLRPNLPRSRYYSSGWPSGVRMDAAGTFYANPASLDFGQGAANITSGNTSLVFTDGGLSSSVTKAVSLAPSGQVKVVPATGANYTLGLSAASGQFSGTFTHAGSTNNFRGIVLNKAANKGGFGYFLSSPVLSYGVTGQSGGVSLEPTP